MQVIKTVLGALKRTPNLLMWFGLAVHVVVTTVVRDMNSMRPSNSVVRRQKARRRKNKKAILFVKTFNHLGTEIGPVEFRNRTTQINQTNVIDGTPMITPALNLLGTVSVHVRWKHGDKVKDWEFTRYVGTCWDGASIPKFLQKMFGSPFQKSQWRPSFVHDFLYAHHVDREIADEAYLYLMQQEAKLDIGWLKEHLMYAGVRLGGWTRYTSAYGKVKTIRKVAKVVSKWL